MAPIILENLYIAGKVGGYNTMKTEAQVFTHLCKWLTFSLMLFRHIVSRSHIIHRDSYVRISLEVVASLHFPSICLD
jgi:hypothetical protein